jgi:ribonuclease-3
MPDYNELYQALAYHFKQDHYLTMALTHRSVGLPNNERLEFLGDALLSCIVAKELFERFTQAREGELTRLRANLVKRDTLVQIAQNLGLGQYLFLGGGELKTGGEQRASILSDAVEALIGAIYLDSGMDVCQSVVLQLWQVLINNLSTHLMKDPKTRLQEYLQAKQQKLPNYQVLAVGGTPHAQEFKVECVIPGLPHPTYGTETTRRRAEQVAAAQALRILNIE